MVSRTADGYVIDGAEDAPELLGLKLKGMGDEAHLRGLREAIGAGATSYRSWCAGYGLVVWTWRFRLETLAHNAPPT